MKDKIITISFLIFIITFSLLGIIYKDNDISYSERRELSKFPKYNFNNDYINKLDKYFLDHYPYRETFRSIKANVNYKLLNRLDNNDIYIDNNYIFKSIYPTDIKSIDNFINKINYYKNYLSKDNNVYMIIIPDKNYYLESDHFLQIDYDYIYSEIDKLNIKKIDVRDILNLSDYYQTDTHWKQENLDKVIRKITNVIDLEYRNINYKYNVYNNFYGVYYGQSALKRDSEKLIYLTNDVIDNIYVKYYENKELTSIYNLDKLKSLDCYEVYLDGASSYIEIYNRNSNSDRELVIFRDSFASSITPLLSPYYKKITLIDNRYISSNNYLNMIDFTNQDIIFMYSTLLVNNSSSLRK